MRFLSLLPPLAAGALLLCVGCGDDDGDSQHDEQLNANAGSNQEHHNQNAESPGNHLTNTGQNGYNQPFPEPPPGLSFGPGHLTFESTAVDQEASEVATLHNEAETAITIGSVELDGDAFSVYPALEDWPEELAPEEELTLEITYQPQNAEEHLGVLTIEWTAEYDNTSTILLEGNQSCVEAATDKLDFSEVEEGETEVASVTITNCGLPTFQITPRVIFHRVPNSPPTQDAPEYDPFSVVNDDPFPHELAAGDSLEIEIEYAPIEEPLWEFALQINTDAPSDPRTMIDLYHGADPGDLPDCDDADTNQYEHC